MAYTAAAMTCSVLKTPWSIKRLVAAMIASIEEVTILSCTPAPNTDLPVPWT